MALLQKSIPWGAVSQAASSATNFAVLIALARSQKVEDFGWTALILGAGMAMVGLSRSVFATPIALLAGRGLKLERESNFGATAAPLVAALLFLPIVVFSIAQGRITVVALALSTPCVVFQDTLRYSCFAYNRAIAAGLADTTRLAVALACIPLAGDISAATIGGIWGISALVSGLGQAAVLSWRPARGLRKHWAATREDRLPLLVESTLIQGGPLITSAIVGLALGGWALSGFRGAGTLLGPINIALSTLPLLAIPALAREGIDDSSVAFRRLVRYSWPLSLSCLGFAVTTIFIPTSVGRLLLSGSWEPTALVLPIAAVQYALQPWSIAAAVAFKLSKRHRPLIFLRTAMTLLTISGVSIAAFLGSLVTVFLTILLVETFMTAVYVWIALKKAG